MKTTKTVFIKYNLEILTAIMFFLVTIAAIFDPAPSITQKFLLAFMFMFTLHEWEENRFPGGFADIMSEMVGKKFSDEAKGKSHIPVFVLLLVIHAVPYIFESVTFLPLVPVFLAIMEGIVHTVGVKLSKAKRFYTPGMITAYLMFALAIFALYVLITRDIITGKDCVLGVLCMIAGFAIMQNRVLAINGITYKDMLNIVASKR